MGVEMCSTFGIIIHVVRWNSTDVPDKLNASKQNLLFAAYFTLIPIWFTLQPSKMEVTRTSETSVNFQRNTRRYIPEDRTIHYQGCKNPISIKDHVNIYVFLPIKEAVICSTAAFTSSSFVISKWSSWRFFEHRSRALNPSKNSYVVNIIIPCLFRRIDNSVFNPWSLAEKHKNTIYIFKLVRYTETSSK
jgi:hypothetical protein